MSIRDERRWCPYRKKTDDETAGANLSAAAAVVDGHARGFAFFAQTASDRLRQISRPWARRISIENKVAAAGGGDRIRRTDQKNKR